MNSNRRIQLTYWETVAVGWRILWQGIGGFLLVLFAGNVVVLGLLPELARSGPSYWALAVPLFAAFTLSLFVVLPLVVRGLITWPFANFRLAVHRGESCPSAASLLVTALTTVLLAALLAMSLHLPAALGTEAADGPLHVVSGTLLKLDTATGRGLLRTDLGRRIYFDIPNVYLFENVVVGARIALRLDDQGRAVKVMDTAIPDLLREPDHSAAARAQDPAEDN